VTTELSPNTGSGEAMARKRTEEEQEEEEEEEDYEAADAMRCNTARTYEQLTRSVSLRIRQFVVTHTIRDAAIPALLGSWITDTPSVKMFCSQKEIASPHIFVKI
jgi:hypothetical protein